MWNFKNNHNIALIQDNGEVITYNTLNDLMFNLSTFFSKKSLVFCLCKNSIGSILGYTTFINYHQVPLLLSYDLDESLLSNLIFTYKPNYFWIPKEKVSYFLGYRVLFNIYDYVLLKNDEAEIHELNDDLALLLTTSGSTGSPKLVRQSYKNIESNTQSIVNYLGINSSERAITTLPMNYTYGLSIINSHLYAGATILLTDKTFFDKSFWNFFKSEKATSFGGVPYTYEILNKLNFFRMDLPSLKTMTQAGGKLLPQLHKKFAEYAISAKKDFIVMYGQTEATARMAYLPADKSLKKYGSMGIAIPGGRFELYDLNEANITNPNVTGELVYYGDNVTLGYAEKLEDLSLGDERKGKLVTGDMAYFDEDGYFYIVGRKKRFLKVFGNRVNLDEVERMIKDEFDVTDCACSGYDDHIYIFLIDNKNIDQVKQFLINKTHLHSTAFKIMAIEIIPKNEAGKINYKELEKYFNE